MSISGPRRTIACVDLFAGAGGLSDGFRQAGWGVLGGLDVDPDAVATYALNFPEAAAYCGDLRNRSLQRRFLQRAQGVDVVAGGPPCQGFSQVRNHSRLIDDPKNTLYREFVAVVGRLQPRAFVMENVPGMAQMGVLDQVLGDLSCRGTFAVRPFLVDAADFGVPQSRKRLILIGVHSDLGCEPPELTGSGVTSRVGLRRLDEAAFRYEIAPGSAGNGAVDASVLADPWDDAAVTAKQALSDLIGLRPNTTRADEQPALILEEPQSAYQKVMRADLGDTISNIGVPRLNEDTRCV